MRKITFSLFLLLFLFLLSQVSLAVPTQINYQGLLKDSTGNLVSGKVNMTFTIYDGDGPGATILWNETQNGITLEAGLYSVRLGSQTDITPEVFSGDTTYLEVAVNGQTFSPRIPLISVPYAFQAEELGGLSAEAFVKLGPSARQDTGAEIGIDIMSTGSLGTGIRAESGGTGVYGKSVIPSMEAFQFEKAGVLGEGEGFGVRGLSTNGWAVSGSSTSGIGVSGVATDNSATNYGVYGQTNSNNGYAGYFKGRTKAKGSFELNDPAEITGSTPSVSGGNIFVVTNPGPGRTNITNFTGGVTGQIIILYFPDDYSRVLDSSPIHLNGNFDSSPGDTLQLMRGGENWYEISRSAN